ncbi:eukaryotic translation initiation factor 3 subunit A [Bacidia gigantensis]|uniref:eukaryotic translation initiation factor 3 subunit A n=1 Tax=Bacidia gigantensis TaxID=2732470 RepID=UPI001D05247A|nr:eukaryotic translation initiation factor 3 subunit A [Bacidia gigantensis]KAG8526903.1 eukaryotic translation initiation factor 3 subunit A [Bacidia gigantensis]
MPPPPHTRPENVLKRAQELIAVDQSTAALTILHEHVTSKRSRNSPITSLEPVMLAFVKLCVDLKKGKLAKDGLYQYKNTAQNTNVGTIELVLKKFISLAEDKVSEAQEKAEQIQSTQDPGSSGANVEDLEAIETPESILLSTVSGEQAKDRTDRAVVTPWLKFLWETYRTVLEILKNNARLEVMYQATALLAFGFCQKFARKTEFRRLCELLRNHVQNAAKYQSQMHAINLSDPDTLQRHLDTRFEQLNVAVELELWQEAFRSVEDIHTLLSLSKRPAKNIMMANYYEKLTRIFLVSENYLFHAAAWSRYYNLLRQSASNVMSGQSSKKDNPIVTDSDMARAASFVLLSALAIPVISTSRSKGALVDFDEARKNKNNRLTNLLGMSSAPTRTILFKDALSKGLLRRAKPEIRELYQILEVDFHPLSICKKISPILTQIGADPDMEKYVLPLQQVILTRLFQQLSQVYESVELKYVHQLAQFPESYQVTTSTIEKFIMNGCKKGDLAMRIDHTTGVLTFDSDVFSSAKALHPSSVSGFAEGDTSSVQRLQRTPAEIVRSQLTRLAKTLYVTCQHVDPEFNEARQQAKAAALTRAAAGAEQEHQETLARRAIIEKKKELASDALQKKQKEEETRKRIIAQQRQEAEAQRLAEEHKERERKRKKEEQDRIRRENNENEIKDLLKKGINIGDVDVKDLDSNGLRLLRISQLEKEKNDLNKNLRVTGKRIDHLERAFRKEELKLLPKDYEAQRQRDLSAYEQTKSETLEETERKHKEDVALKHRLSRLLPTYETFHKDLKERRHDEFEKRRKSADREYNNAIEKRKRDHREQRAREEREREEAQRQAREEEERIVREEEEKAAAEEEKKRLQAEAKAKRDEERRALDEKAALQRQREAEAEAKLQAKKNALSSGSRIPDRSGPSGPSRPAIAERTESSERPVASGPPRLNLAGNKPTWREREAARAHQGGGAPPSAPSSDVATDEVQLPKRTTGYVPPSKRGGVESGLPSRGRPEAAAARSTPREETSTEPTAKWRPSVRQDGLGRDGSPAEVAPSQRFLGGLRGPQGRDVSADSSRPVSSDGTTRTESPAEPLRKPAPGKFVPPHLRNK